MATNYVVVDLVGIAAFALSGALVAVRKPLDIFGVLVLAGATGLGGGFLRDVLIGATPPASLMDWRYLMVPVVAGLIAFRFHPVLGRLESKIAVFDAAGMGLFCVTGAVKSLDYGLEPVAACLMGMVTAIGGGVIRDLLAGRVPVVLREELYAFPALLGAAIAVTAVQLDLPYAWVVLPGALFAFGYRMIALRRGWQAPLPSGMDGY
ncbi:trimeric intracellular cation channel family protein [Mumia sp. zg.B53]|uniref:trimeric intracellular cation channel family protein n=1 Tax=unclassified Mumia TaxID=2621872 RepID=UPI001C6E2D21|nr:MULTISPECIES: trimeric intracellular cation channel family protein [unclassified Mumia]MBW9205288.1 trimeric intracellular cation channel family protein [Mumia sp. zg.B17]MBW9208713.1 trimeric intracellular cation channel family protein [Mumia sp. zg.B21]MBW9213324.1 trimeric intracellular cation channel family protein [Mumia sp. zg.B53]MDD9349184.1 trimeric intracellular cation channel family protein [Mumia sp.]